MANFPTGIQARENAQNNNLIKQEIAILEIAVLDAITANTFSATVNAASTVSINVTTITGSPMTNNNATGQAFYTVWQGTTTDTVKSEQMTEVITHFTNLKYTISRKSISGTVFYWYITW
tara:strand:+ start:444 stop:803 length:360 start_codon:yes stop_codon:yes gene_type:complete